MQWNSFKVCEESGKHKGRNGVLHMHISRPLLSLLFLDSAGTLKLFHCINSAYICSLAQVMSLSDPLITINMCVSNHSSHSSKCMHGIHYHSPFLKGWAPLKISTVVPLSICMHLCICELCRFYILPNCVHVNILYICVHSDAKMFFHVLI